MAFPVFHDYLENYREYRNFDSSYIYIIYAWFSNKSISQKLLFIFEALLQKVFFKEKTHFVVRSIASESKKKNYHFIRLYRLIFKHIFTRNWKDKAKFSKLLNNIIVLINAFSKFNWFFEWYYWKNLLIKGNGQPPQCCNADGSTPKKLPNECLQITIPKDDPGLQKRCLSIPRAADTLDLGCDIKPVRQVNGTYLENTFLTTRTIRVFTLENIIHFNDVINTL